MIINLTPREREIITLVAQGKKNKEIAAVLNMSPHTVKSHRQRMMLKLNIHSTAGLTMYAYQHGLIPLAV